jgi:hypothetical protein
MGLIKSIKMSKRKFYRTQAVNLDNETALAFVCDEVIILPVKSRYVPFFKNIDVVICQEGEPIYRLKGGGDVIFMESSSRSYKIDVLEKSKLTRIIPTTGRMRVDWDGIDLHVTRIGDDSSI